MKKDRNNMHYKKTGEDIIQVSRQDKFTVYCKGVKAAKHTNLGIELTPTAVGGVKYTIDPNGHKRY